MKNNEQDIFFILGCQRSGSTLLRLILETHSQIFCFDESKCYQILANRSLLENELLAHRDKKWLGFKALRITEQMQEPFLADYGMDFRAPNFYQKKPIIFVVRNVYDTIASMKNRFENGRYWIEEWPKTTISFHIKTNPTFSKTYKNELAILKNTKYENIVAASIYWKFKNLSFFEYLESSLPIIKIHYEDLVKDSKTILEKILKFLNLEWEDALLAHEKITHPETDENGITVGGTKVKNPIFSSSVDNYKKSLNSEEISAISQVANDLMLKLNYEI